MKKILTFIVLLTASVFAMTCNAEVKYKGYLNVGGSVTSGDTYSVLTVFSLVQDLVLTTLISLLIVLTLTK